MSRGSRYILLGLLVASSLCVSAGAAMAGPGSGTAQMWPAIDPVAGSFNRWTLRYTATEDFADTGGMVTVEIPAGWSAPQLSDSGQAGFVFASAEQGQDLDSVTVTGMVIRLYLGGDKKFRGGEYAEVIYGASSTFAVTQTTAQDSVEFAVRSDPDNHSPQPLTSGSPTVDVVAGSAVDVAIYFAGSEAGDLGFDADENSNVFSARGVDTYGNPTGGVNCTWSVSGGIGTLSGGVDSTNTFDATTAGTGYISAQDGSGNVDSTGVITVTHGAYARLDVAQPDSAVAGQTFPVSVAALDADGNTVTSGTGSGGAVWVSAWLDSMGAARATGNLSDTTLTLTGGLVTASETYTVAESIYVRAIDTLNATILDFGPSPTTVTPASPSVLSVSPDTLSLEAGTQGTFTVTSFDAYGNESPVSLDQTFFLWTNSSSGEFRQVGGAQEIFEVQMPADSFRVLFDYYDTSPFPFQIAVMDADANAPSFPVTTAHVAVDYSSASALVVSGIADPVVAGTSSDVVVEVQDSFGNRVRDYAGTVEFSSTDGGAQTVLPVDYTFAASDSGRHVFPLEVTLTTAGEQSVSAADASQPSVNGTQGGITVNASNCDTLLLASSSTPVAAGGWLDVEVEARDTYGNRAKGYTGVVGFSCTDTGDSTVLPPFYQFTAADEGLHVLSTSLRLTTAGGHTLSVADTSQSQIDGTLAGLQVVAGAAASVVLSPSGSFNVNAGATQVLSATVSDTFGNLRSGELTSVVLKDAADGSLEDDPANPNDTSGGTSIQTGNTDASGVITVLYRAPLVSGLIDTIDAYCSTVPHGSVSDAYANSTSSGATSLSILPVAALTDTAAATMSVVIEATDSFGNVDTSDTSLVRLVASSATARISTDGGTSWSLANTDSLKLVAGSTQSRAKLRNTSSGSLGLLAQDTQGVLIDASKNNITVTPALPAGAVGVYPGRDTLTADGQSFTLVVAGPFVDAYGNNVGSGETVTASAALGEILAADVDSLLSGVQLLTAANGTVSFALRAGSTAGFDTVRVSSVNGTAAGSVEFVFLDPPLLQYVTDSVSPDAVSTVQAVSFSTAVQNTGGSRVYLFPSSTFSLDDGNDGSCVANLADTAVVLAGGSATLTFEVVAVPAEMDPGSYSPILNLAGQDATGDSFAQNIQAGTNTVRVVSMKILAISAGASVTRGTQDVPVQMTILNEGTLPVEITAAGLTFSSTGHSDSLVSPALPETLQNGQVGVFTFAVDVSQLAPLGTCTIDGFGAGIAGGTNVSDTGADSTGSWLVQSPASVSYVNGSLATQSVSLGQTHSLSARILNSGTASVQLDTSGTFVKFGPSGDEYVAFLDAPSLLGGSSATTVRFASHEVQASMTPGTYRVGMFLSGTENGATFADTLFCDPESVTVQLPVVLEHVAIRPETVSTGYGPAFEVTLRNTGQATAFLQPQTRIGFGGGPVAFTTFLSDSLALEADSVRTLTFNASPLDTGFTTGRYLPLLTVRMRENGIFHDSLFATGSDSVLVQRKALLAWVPGSLTPSRVTAGQTAGFSLQVTNNGEATVALDPILCQVSFKDAEHEFAASGQGTLVQIAPQATGQLDFAIDTVDAGMANQTYSVELAAAGVENGFPFDDVLASPQGELVVESPALLAYSYGTVKPQVVTQEQDVVFTLGIENRGDATLFIADSTLLHLGALSDTVDCSGGCAIAGHGTVSLSFKGMRIDSTAIATGRYPVSLDISGTDWNGFSLLQTLATSPDSVAVSAPGDLRIRSTAARSSNAPYVDTSQDFQVDVEIENLGEEDASDVLVTLTSTGGSGIVSPAPLQSIGGGGIGTVSFAVQAGPAAGNETFTAQIQSAVGAISGLPLSIGSAVDDTTDVIIQTPASLSVTASIQEPVGATDGTVSTLQSFKLSATVTNNGSGTVGGGGTLRMNAPPGFGRLSPEVQSFAPGVPVEWTFGSPSGATGPSAFVVTMESLPMALNTGQEADTAGASGRLYLSVVERASLSLSVAIVAPPDATDGSLRVGETFTVEATVSNSGTAATSGSGTLTLSLPSGYSMSTGAPADQDFSVGTPVRWEVVAPSVSSPIEYITATITVTPLDENTNAEAHVVQGTRELGVYAESKDMIAEVLSLVEAPVQIAAGESSVRFMALRIENPAETGEGSSVGLRSIAFFVRGEDNVRLADPSTVLSAINVSRYSSPDVPLGVAGGLSANPVRVDLVPEADTLAPGESDTLLVSIDVAQSPLAGGVALEIEDASAFDAFDSSSGEQIGVVAPDGGSFQLALTPPSRLFTGVHNYPNPFQAGSESTHISYFLQGDSRVSLKIYTLDGKLVFSRAFSAQEPEGRRGLREVLWDGRNGRGELVLNGVYVCKLEAGGIDATFKIAVAK